MATVGMLQAVGESLVSIFGQHEHRVLLDPEEHIDILDKFGGAGDLRKNTAEAFGNWKKTSKELAAAEAKLKKYNNWRFRTLRISKSLPMPV